MSVNLIILFDTEIRQDAAPLLSFTDGMKLKKTQCIPSNQLRLIENILQGQRVWNVMNVWRFFPQKGKYERKNKYTKLPTIIDWINSCTIPKKSIEPN